METQVCRSFYVDGVSVTAEGTFRFMRAGADMSAPERNPYLCASLTGSFPRGHISRDLLS